MNGTLNKVILIGHLGDEVKMHYFEGGNCIGRFPLATNEVYINKTPGKFILDDVWVNYQKSGEFNPLHDHRGVYSWVIWLELPYTLKEEDAQVPWTCPDKNFAGQFVIHYTDIVGNIKNYPLPTDQRLRSYCAVFPSRLRHSVYPFYSTDQYRISVSGNFLAG
jgi:hypothetical protein